MEQGIYASLTAFILLAVLNFSDDSHSVNAFVADTVKSARQSLKAPEIDSDTTSPTLDTSQCFAGHEIIVDEDPDSFRATRGADISSTDAGNFNCPGFVVVTYPALYAINHDNLSSTELNTPKAVIFLNPSQLSNFELTDISGSDCDVGRDNNTQEKFGDVDCIPSDKPTTIGVSLLPTYRKTDDSSSNTCEIKTQDIPRSTKGTAQRSDSALSCIDISKIQSNCACGTEKAKYCPKVLQNDPTNVCKGEQLEYCPKISQNQSISVCRNKGLEHCLVFSMIDSCEKRGDFWDCAYPSKQNLKGEGSCFKIDLFTPPNSCISDPFKINVEQCCSKAPACRQKITSCVTVTSPAYCPGDENACSCLKFEPDKDIQPKCNAPETSILKCAQSTPVPTICQLLNSPPQTGQTRPIQHDEEDINGCKARTPCFKLESPLPQCQDRPLQVRGCAPDKVCNLPLVINLESEMRNPANLLLDSEEELCNPPYVLDPEDNECEDGIQFYFNSRLSVRERMNYRQMMRQKLRDDWLQRRMELRNRLGSLWASDSCELGCGLCAC